MGNGLQIRRLNKRGLQIPLIQNRNKKNMFLCHLLKKKEISISQMFPDMF